MANFDSNRWYQVLNTAATTALSLDGSSLYNEGRTGTVYYQPTNNSLPGHQWQIFAYNSSSYVLRTRDSGPGGVLGVEVSVNETTPGSTVPYMVNYTLADSSMFWQISPWGDGTFFMTNAANGTAWHLDVKPNTLMVMSSNITAPQPNQAFSFSTLSEINDSRFSTIMTPTATATSTTNSLSSTGTTSSSPSSSTTSSTSSGSSGLSAGASAAIGASIGAVALIAILIAGYFLLRRRKIRAAAATASDQPTAYETAHELPHQAPRGPYSAHPKEPLPGQGVAELQVPPAELSGRQRAPDPVELPSDAPPEKIVDGRTT